VACREKYLREPFMGRVSYHSESCSGSARSQGRPRFSLLCKLLQASLRLWVLNIVVKLALFVNRSDRLSSAEMPSSRGRMRSVDHAS
jgi:hypothetical protein